MLARARTGPRKSIFDPVHGVIGFSGLSLALIGQGAFQRLWGIRQTGFAHLVFPGANHTRLEHSLGVYAVASAMAETLDLSAEDAALVGAGGLLHDLGHPPFSHTLEATMREVLGHGHERVSRSWIIGERTGDPVPDGRRPRSIPELLEANGVSPAAVADLVDPPPGREPRPLLRAMLHGAIDADRIDYLQRDAHYTGVAHGAIDAARLLDTVRARGGRLVFAEKGRSAVEGFLVGRALMYSSVYYHKTVRAAEVMAQAAVERGPGFPEAAAELFGRTDGELLVELRRRGGLPERLVRMLLERDLYKRAYAARSVGPALRDRLRRLALRPSLRRETEDALAARLGAPPGTVLLDLTGLDAREPAGSDWSEVGVLEGDRLAHPFRPPSVWRALALRPPTLWAASVYVAPRYRAAAERWFGRSGLRLP